MEWFTDLVDSAVADSQVPYPQEWADEARAGTDPAWLAEVEESDGE